jgi:acyl carrier protein
MTDSNPTGARVEPSTEVERRILEIWREVMGNAEIGLTDDFWELGGNSLMGQQVMARITQTIHVEPPFLLLFEAPTVETLAVAITNQIIDELDETGQGGH